MVNHDLNSAFTYSDKVCLMDRGEIIIYDSPQAVYESGQIERIFNIDCDRVYIDRRKESQYVFSIR